MELLRTPELRTPEAENQPNEIDNRRRYYVLCYSLAICTPFIFIFGLASLTRHDTFLSLILFTFSGAFALNSIYLASFQDLDKSCHISSILTCSFTFVLLYHGGVEQSALIWILPFPVIIFGINNARNGLIICLVQLTILSIMLYTPDLTRIDYDAATKSRFLLTFLVVTLFSWVNDFYRERSHKSMNTLHKSKYILANTDPLTKLANRRYIESSLVKSIGSNPGNYLPLGIIMCDIDHFKKLNDTLGHDAGDEILIEAANIFTRTTRSRDAVCRVGGEEFIIFLPRSHIQESVKVAEKIREEIETHLYKALPGIKPVTVSMGVSICKGVHNFEEMIKAADKQLYNAKNRGRNQIAFVDSSV